MVRILACFLFAFLANLSADGQSLKRPRLVVGIVVDQMRQDYLYRFYDRYSENGFKRLLKGGFQCEQTYINYLPAYTAPGHACIYTGTVPAVHGIAGNDWIDIYSGKRWYCVEDTSVTPVECSMAAGRMSPSSLRTTTITDELMLATRARSRVVGIALKDRGSILPAGHLGKAYWFDDSTGNFITSSYYADALPSWLKSFNGRRLTDSLLSQPWNTLYPAGTYVQSLPDDNPYEGRFDKSKPPVFPHHPGKGKSYGNIRRLPAGNTLTLEAAKAALTGEQMGKGRFPDFLCVSLSSTDYIGHQFAPESIEIEDMYLRLDQELAEFFHFLDRHAGKGNYLLFLTADHGGAHNAKYLQDIGIPAGNIGNDHLNELVTGATRKALDQLQVREIQTGGLIKGVENYQIFLNKEGIRDAHLDEARFRNALKKALSDIPEMAWVLDMEAVASTPMPAIIKEKAVNGYYHHRSGDLLMIFQPGYYNGYDATGTTHGTWHPYDTRIPLLWYGWGIQPGRLNRKVHMEDIAPTIATLLGIQVPNGCTGNVITELTDGQ